MASIQPRTSPTETIPDTPIPTPPSSSQTCPENVWIWICRGPSDIWVEVAPSKIGVTPQLERQPRVCTFLRDAAFLTVVVTTIHYNQGKTSGEHNFVIWKLLTEKRDCFAKWKGIYQNHGKKMILDSSDTTARAYSRHPQHPYCIERLVGVGCLEIPYRKSLSRKPKPRNYELIAMRGFPGQWKKLHRTSEKIKIKFIARSTSPQWLSSATSSAVLRKGTVWASSPRMARLRSVFCCALRRNPENPEPANG